MAKCNNKVNINKKNGILIIENNCKEDNDINGYPLKNMLKYLLIEKNVGNNPIKHLYVIIRKLSDFRKRNK